MQKRNCEEDIKWFKKEAELHELAMQKNKDRMQLLEEDLHKSESDLAIAKGEAQRQFHRNRRLREALDQIATVAELLIEEGSVNGPISLHGCCIKARSVLANKFDIGDLVMKNRTYSERDVYKAAGIDLPEGGVKMSMRTDFKPMWVDINGATCFDAETSNRLLTYLTKLERVVEAVKRELNMDMPLPILDALAELEDSIKRGVDNERT